MTTYDLLIFSGYVPNTQYASAIELFDATTGSEACTGIIKLAQRWLLEFLTETGSQTNQPTRGCGFLTAFRLGQMQTEAAVEAQFRFAETTVLRNLLSDNTDTTPLDETLASATLDSIAILPGNLQLTISIVSAAGSTRTVAVPIGTIDITGG